MSQTQDLRRDMQRQLRDLAARITKQIQTLADAIAAVNAKTRRAAGSTDFAAAGSQSVAITWLKEFPDDQYGVWPTIYTTNPAQVHCVPLPGTKTAAGITLTVVAASAVGTVTLDVLGVRT